MHVRAERALSRAIGGVGFLFRQTYGLDAVSTRIWRVLAGGLPLATICATIDAEYAVEPDVVQRDVLKFVTELCEKRLLARQSG